MFQHKLNRNMAEFRFLNPQMYQLINQFLKKEIVGNNLFKFKFVLTYLTSYLEIYLNLNLKKFYNLERERSQNAENQKETQFLNAL